MLNKIDTIIIVLVITYLGFITFDINNTNFSWMAFQERDYDRSIQFLLGNGLSHFGPEISGGGFIPGPFLTLFYAIPILIFKEPIGIFLTLQFCYLLNLTISFFLIKKYFSAELAWMSLLVLLTSSSFYMYVFTGWHAAFAPTMYLLSLLTIDRAVSSSKFRWFILTGFLFGVTIQFHFSSLLAILFTAPLLLKVDVNKIVRLILCLSTGFLFTFIYYIYFDGVSNFENTYRILFSRENSDRNLVLSIQSVLDFLLLYFSRITLGPWNGFNLLYDEILKGNQFYFLVFALGVIKVVFFIAGTFIFIFGKNNISIKLFFLLFLLIPIIFYRPEARWFMFAHPIFEIVVSFGILGMLNKIMICIPNTYSIKRKANTAFTILLILLLLGIDRVVSSKSIVPPYIDQFTSSIYPNFYKNHKKITDVLLKDIRLHPSDYKNRFFLYRGNSNWTFQTQYQLPSWSHYQFLYDKKEVKDPINLNGNSIILLPKSEMLKIDLTNIKVVETKKIDDFIIIIYDSPYTFKTPPLYLNLSENEIKIQNNNFEDINELDDRSLLINKYVKINTHYKTPIRFLNKLYIENTNNGVEGFFEIEGPTLRQSAFYEQAPHFLVNPKIAILLKDGVTHEFQLLKHNLYKNEFVDSPWDVHKFYGDQGREFLGSLFNETPYGRVVTIDDIDVKDIIEVRFFIKGYGDITSFKKEKQKKSIQNHKWFNVKVGK